MEIKDIRIEVPAGWHSLSQDGMRFVFAMMVLYADRQEAWRYVAMRLALDAMNVYEACPYGDGFMFDYDGYECAIDAEAMYDVFRNLEWLSTIPEEPVRIDTIGDGHAMSEDPTPELTFAQWMALENLYQGYQFTQDPNLLTEMARILYRSERIEPLPGELISVFYWFTSVKALMAQRFPDFFRPSPVSGNIEPPDADELRRSMDAQIRALTKGDVTKEEQILSLPADRALTELNALAREYAELNKKYPQKS